MITICSLVILTLCSLPITSASILPGNFSTHYHEQRIDHFAFTNNASFRQRIIVSVDHWRNSDSGVIFFYAGNEGNIMTFANNTGFMWDRAPEFGAMVVFAEHRYYGESLPFGNDSFKTREQFGYLTAEQALADFAENIFWLKREYDAEDAPVIMFGGSYGGMLAAWFRMKYPHLALGALAASAPVWQFPGIYDCHGYFAIVTRDFSDYSQTCSDTIRASWPLIRDRASSEAGRRWLSQTFNLCPGEELSSESSIERFVAWISSAYEYMAMTDYPNPAVFLQPMPAYPIRETCKHLTNPDATPDLLLTDIFRAVSVFYNYTGSVKCNTLAFNEMDRGWNIQSCAEMVMPVCSDGVKDMFEKNDFNLTSIRDRCLREYGIVPDPDLALREWGPGRGKDLSAASNIIFSNGDRDPWSAGGVTATQSPSVHLVQIPHACHHEDLRSPGPDDPPALLATRQEEADIIAGWIKQFRRDQRRRNFV